MPVLSLSHAWNEIAVGILILAACPGGPTSNLIAHLAKGDTALTVTLTALSSFITILTIRFIVNFALTHFLGEGQVVRLNVVETITQIFVIIVIPVVIGMIIRHFKEGFARRMTKPVRTASEIVIALVIIGIVIKEKEYFIFCFQQAGLVALALNAAKMRVGLRFIILAKGVSSPPYFAPSFFNRATIS